jgi:hypothetical protein
MRTTGVISDKSWNGGVNLCELRDDVSNTSLSGFRGKVQIGGILKNWLIRFWRTGAIVAGGQWSDISGQLSVSDGADRK